jgi:tRNA C32,U32 (ribose-2'-O)-methylase TrmJ
MTKEERDKHKRDLAALSAAVSSVLALRGIGVSAVYVKPCLMNFLRGETRESCMEYDYAGVLFGKTRTGLERVTIQPYGAVNPIPVKTKYSGVNPWKATIGYRKD